MILRSGLGCEAKEWIGKVEKLHKTENSILTLKATKQITCEDKLEKREHEA